jgi:hypothetical protein
MTMDEAPDLAERSVLDTAFYEWLLSDHPLAEAERRRRREASFARRAEERDRVREITGRWPADAPEDKARLRESLGRLTQGQAQRDRWDRAVDDEIGLEKMRAEWETHVRVSGDDPDYRYPAHYCGPEASQYPPPPPVQDGRGSQG